MIIFNCKCCKVGKRIEYPLRDKIYEGYGRYSYRAYREGDIVNQGFGRMAPRKIYPADDSGCPTCGKPMTYRKIEGYRNESVPCDARCTGARGHSCECSCGGKHHGEQWAA